ncbi:hypothetical protein ACWD04_31675 [Streptomyces sp. NPDC002911]
MVSVAHTPQNIEITAENLREELHRLEAQRQALERELAAVVAHLGSVQTALGALQDLMLTAPPGAGAPAGPRAADVPAKSEAKVAAPAEPSSEPAEPTPTTPRIATPVTRQSSASEASARPAPRDAPADTQSHAKYGRLTEQIAEYFAGTGGSDVRARDVAAALGRDTDAGSINAVRSTLDRLVGTSRIQRAGRGLYRANPS